MKAIKFHLKALEFIQGMPQGIRKQVGETLRDLQKGIFLSMPLSRAMPSVAPGVHELRIKESDKAVRVLYAIKYKDSILVIHGFEKKSQKTPVREIELGKIRLKELLHE